VGKDGQTANPAVATAAGSRHDERMGRLEPGEKAPAFKLRDQDGKTVALSDFKGKKVLIFFYPRADTPGCTRQACAARDASAGLRAKKVAVLGISPDDSAAQKKFDEKFGLAFPLLADVDHAVAEAYGVWAEKNLYGKKSMGILRSSFLVGEDGKIAAAWYRVKPEETIPKAQEALR
jgi:peroxiredoxin Q/BCP